ncbi:flavodoxin family protein [Hydrocarboniclastica marina]|uniref:NADPH-dependent oxidoreductase n=1 Tax=Hydrocarboniclastica marina TaxID=2259620 RepID=A0A4V1D8J8_9ALTE|nr:NAD(P)H-dependent oxidoreductase [Hydrocarboniclastica marina]MAL97022.1 NADPH-dependent oxidoreductase [Alteromonadaceae bacterium]QCF25440.1 NADPH-dependent oxidoreductase [Hydrocarboniclastica marina]|tara:strand:+ start:4789 stop:5397 length:609 start_codon:yes stop_codon:yes gene_type:complete
MSLSAIALNCTLKPSPEESSCGLLLSQVQQEFQRHGIDCPVLRAVDYNLLPGVTSDEGKGDEWPQIRQQILDADILVMGTPIWMGQPSSVCQRVMERIDAFLGETDDGGRQVAYGHVAAVAVVGNEDGAHNVVSQLFQGLNDVGFSIPASCSTYWTGEAMGGTDYKDLPEQPAAVASATRALVQNCAHLAGLLTQAQYPAKK